MKSILMFFGSLVLVWNAQAAEPSELIKILAKEVVLRASHSDLALGKERLLDRVHEVLGKGEDANDCVLEKFGSLAPGDCPLHLALMIGDPKVVRALIEAGADKSIPKPIPRDIGDSKQAKQIQAVLTPEKMIAFRMEIATNRRAEILKHLAEKPVNESERVVVQGELMPTRLESDLQAIEAQIQLLDELNKALRL